MIVGDFQNDSVHVSNLENMYSSIGLGKIRFFYVLPEVLFEVNIVLNILHYHIYKAFTSADVTIGAHNNILFYLFFIVREKTETPRGNSYIH